MEENNGTPPVDAPPVETTPVETATTPDFNFREHLPQELKDSPALKDVKDIGSLAKQLIDAQTYIGTTIRPPSADAAPEDIETFLTRVEEKSFGKLMRKPDLTNDEQSNNFYEALGKPKELDGYTTPEFEGIELNPAFLGQAKAIAHELNLTDKQFKNYIDGEVKRNQASSQAVEAAWTEDIAGLKQEWGMAFDEKVNVAHQIAKITGAPDTLMKVIEAGTADAPTLRWLETLHKQLGGEGSEIAGQLGGATEQTPHELRSREAELQRKVASLDKENTVAAKEEQKEIYAEILKIHEKLTSTN